MQVETGIDVDLSLSHDDVKLSLLMVANVSVGVYDWNSTDKGPACPKFFYTSW